MNTIHYVIISILVTVGVGAVAGRESDAQTDEPATLEQARRDRAAQAVCREAYGHDALWFWTPEGHLVCRRGKGLL